MRTRHFAHRITSACFDQQFILRSGAVFLWTAVPYRMTWRYGERGYRDLHLDAGHVCQNLYLAAEAVGCGVCAIAAFDDDRMNELLGINGTDQFLIYLATVGKKEELQNSYHLRGMGTGGIERKGVPDGAVKYRPVHRSSAAAP